MLKNSSKGELHWEGSSVGIQTQLAILYNEIGDYEKAIDILQEQTNPDFESSCLEASCLGKLNRKTDACSIYESLLHQQMSTADRSQLRLKLLTTLDEGAFVKH